MKTRTKIVIGIVVILIVAVLAFTLYWETHHGNRQVMDLKYRFNRAVIRLPNGEVVDGKVSSWLDYANSDAVQVTIDGKTYLTHYSNVCLMDD